MAYCSVEDMRYAISKVYPGKSWQYKVSRMPDYQVIAIYYSFLRSGKFDQPAKKKKEEEVYYPVQLTFDDILQRRNVQ